MVDITQIRPHMEVYASDGIKIGVVDHLDGGRIKLAKTGSPDGSHHYVSTADIDRIDEHVHLSRTAAAILAAGGAANDSIVPPIRNPAVEGSTPRRNYYLPWILAALALLVLLLLLGFCHRKETVAADPADTTAGGMLPVEAVTLPNGEKIDLEPRTLNYELQRYLASSEAAPRTFTFDSLNFDTASASIRPQDQPTVDALARILAAYPKTVAKVVGYTNARGTAPANANLGQARSTAVVGALVAKGVDAARITAVSGGESNPTDTNATAQGRLENRRTELTVTGK